METREASDWLQSALARAPEEQHVISKGTRIELLTWGKRGRPGVFLLHGAGAHAHWWDAVAPLLAQDYRVAAMTSPGNGASQWRERYSSADLFDDALACVAAADLAAAGKPFFIGHSMGGAHLMHGAAHAPDTMRALMLVDTSFRAPRADRPVAGDTTRRSYASKEEALSRFRLMPPGPARESALLQHVAHHALTETRDVNGTARWYWSADPAYFQKLERGIEQGPYASRLRPAVSTFHLIAENSHVATAVAELPLSDEVPRILLPDCGHHVMLDRPLVLVAALRALLATQ